MKGSEQTLITACHVAGNNRKSQLCPEDEEADVFFFSTHNAFAFISESNEQIQRFMTRVGS